MTQIKIPRMEDSFETGDMNEYFKHFTQIIEKNSGVHTNHCIVTDSIEPQCPIEAGVYTKLKRSDENVDVCLFEQISYISMTIRLNINVHVDDINPNVCMDDDLSCFVGFKSSIQHH